jgi:esterase/lipase superfamily enzyme
MKLPFRLHQLGVYVASLLAMAAAAQTVVPADAYLLHITVVDGANRTLPGSEIRIDNTVAGVTDDTGQYYMARRPVPDGPHTLSVSRRGFMTASRTVNDLSKVVQGGKAGVELRFKLIPAPAGLAAPVTRNAFPEPNYDIVQVFYATDRADTKNADPALRYSGERSTALGLSRGICEVSIPATHVVGELESPSWLRFEYTPDPAKHVVLKSIQPLERDPFYEKLSARVASSPSKEVVVFIHGFNNSFEHAARQAAQIARDASFDGAPVLYSWPSKNRLVAYTEDEDTVQWTAFHLRDFLDELAQRTHASRIHLIAHSMGNRALTSALQMIASKERPRGTSAPPFDQIVLAAPDIGADTLTLFAREIGSAARRMTLYASANDDALLVSSFIHGGNRAGQKDGYLLVAPGIDTVDASAARTDFIGHGYFGQSASIIDDIRKIFTNEAPPELRNLVPAVIRDLRYWIIPGPAAPEKHP